MPAVREGDTLVVSGIVEHAVYPGRRDEIEQQVVLGREHDVRGALYARRLRADAPGVVHGPVFSQEDLTLDERTFRNRECHDFRSGLTCPGTIRNEAVAFEAGSSAVVSLANARLRVKGPILADTVHLTNAVIIGNIHARRVTLEGCVVFGIIDCDEDLVMSTCHFVAYRAGRVKLMGRLSTWLGAGVSYDAHEFVKDDSRAHLETGRDAQKREVPADLRYLPICRSRVACPPDKKEGFDTCNLYHAGTCTACKSSTESPVARVSLTDLDFQLRILDRPAAAGQTPGDETIEARRSDGAGPEPWQLRLADLPGLLAGGLPPDRLELRHGSQFLPFYEHPAFRQRFIFARVLTVAGRILNTSPVKRAITEITDLGRTLAHYDHLDPESRSALRAPDSDDELFRMGTAIT